MSNTICIDNNLFVFGIIILVGITFYYITNIKNCPVCPICPINNNDIVEEEVIQTPIDPLIVRDRNVINDPLTAPTRRVPRHVYPIPPLSTTINIPTRGATDNYQYMGNLVRSADEKIVKLFGRETYPGSIRYEYYGIATDSAGHVKVKIETHNNKELEDGEEVDISVFDISKGKFKLYLNDDDTLRYNPYII